MRYDAVNKIGIRLQINTQIIQNVRNPNIFDTLSFMRVQRDDRDRPADLGTIFG